MLSAPGLDPRGVIGAAEVVAVGGLFEPAALALLFADPATIGLGAVALVMPITKIGNEELVAMQTLGASRLPGHKSEEDEPARRSIPNNWLGNRVQILEEGRRVFC